MANTLFWLGDNEEVLACLQRGDLLPENGDERIGAQGFDIVGLAMTLEGLTLFQTGSFRRARTTMEKLRLRGEREAALTFNRVISLQGAAWLACLFEDAAQLGPLATMLESIARIHGYAFYQGIGKFFIGQHLVFQDAFEEAEHHMHDGYENYMLRDGGKLSIPSRPASAANCCCSPAVPRSPMRWYPKRWTLRSNPTSALIWSNCRSPRPEPGKPWGI